MNPKSKYQNMSKETIIFLHGALGSSKNFADLHEICNGSFECVLLDFPEHGNNEMEMECTIENLSEYLIDFISTHCKSPVSIFGYSMGGYIALHALTQRPDLFNKVMTLATKLNWNENEAAMQIAKLNAEKIEAKVPQFVNQLTSLHPAHHWKDVLQTTANIIEKLGAAPPLHIDLLRSMEHPICLGLGDQDTMVSISETENLYRQLQKGRMYLIPNMQHPIEKMKVHFVYEIMKDFFNC